MVGGGRSDSTPFAVLLLLLFLFLFLSLGSIRGRICTTRIITRIKGSSQGGGVYLLGAEFCFGTGTNHQACFLALALLLFIDTSVYWRTRGWAGGDEKGQHTEGVGGTTKRAVRRCEVAGRSTHWRPKNTIIASLITCLHFLGALW